MVREVLWLRSRGQNLFGTPVGVYIGNVAFWATCWQSGKSCIMAELWHWLLYGSLQISHAFLPTLKPKSHHSAAITTLTKSRNGCSLGFTSYHNNGPYLGIRRSRSLYRKCVVEV